MAERKAGFSVPDFSAPIDLEAVRRTIPAHGCVKGYFLAEAANAISSLGSTPVVQGPFRAFKDYPALDTFDLFVQWAKTAHPSVPLREGLRRIGRRAYPSVAGTLAGKIVFGVLGKDLRAITKLASKAYELSSSHQHAKVLEVGENHSVVLIEDIYYLMDTYHVGAFEGVLISCQRPGTVSIRQLSAHSAEIYSEWK